MSEEMQKKHDEIAAMIINFCDAKLNDEFKGICLRLLGKLRRKRPSPLLGGRSPTWAAGIVYAIGQVNFIFDKAQKIYMPATELASDFGISASTAGSKANEIRNMFHINYFNSEWLLQEFIETNFMTWMIKVNGFIVDVRTMPLEIQQQAFEMGIIPYVPGEKETSPFEYNNDQMYQKPSPPAPKQKPEDPRQNLLF